MKSLWLACLPLLFLPNFGQGKATSYGTLELSDYLIGPFLVLVSMAGVRRSDLAIHRLTPVLLGFAAWALVSTLTIRERYGYPEHNMVLIGLLKLGKVALYALAAVLAARALVDEAPRRHFPWALMASGMVVAFSLIRIHDRSDAFSDRLSSGYKAENAISVMMAILLCYLGGLWACGQGTPRWRSLGSAGLLLIIPGFLASHGRGGWFAALCGTFYIFYRRGLSLRIMLALAGVAAMVVIAYVTIPEFCVELDRTIWPDQAKMARLEYGVGGFDDGARMGIWTHELGALWRSPLIGSGFFHRGNLSGLWETGSHNFFLQMFLETGLVGGLLILHAFRRMWQLAGSEEARDAGEEIPVRAALVSAFVGGLTGEYFYGGIVLFTLLLVFAPVGGLIIRRDAVDEPLLPEFDTPMAPAWWEEP